MKDVSALDKRIMGLWDKFEAGTLNAIDASVHINFCTIALKVKIDSHHLKTHGNLELEAPEVKVITVRPHRRRQAGAAAIPSRAPNAKAA
jgi:hypothetical protein